MLKKILILTSFLIIVILFTGCSSRTVYLSNSDRVYVIPKGTEFTSDENGKREKIIAPIDLVAEGKGDYFDKIKKLNGIGG